MTFDSVAMTTLVPSECKQETVCIFGTGDFGRSLGLRLLQAGYRVIFGSRDPGNTALLPEGSRVTSHAEAIKSARVIFVALHRDHYPTLTPLTPALAGKVLVDVSNNLKRGEYPQSNAEHLSRLVPGAAVVKAFNTISAWALQSGALDASRQVLVCGDSAEAKQAVMDIAHSLGLMAQDRGSLRSAGELEDLPLQLLPLWRLPLRIAAALLAFFFIYELVRDVVFAQVTEGKDKSFRIMISLANKIFPVVSLIMLALCYLPGIMAAALQLHNGTKYKRFPDWLDRWMLCRKQLGLVALALAFLHVLYTLVIPIRYFVRYKIAAITISQIRENKTKPFDSTLAWRADSYYSLGILGFGLYVLLGITSLPSVSNSLNWREFRFVQSKLGHMTLLLCTAHTFLFGWDKFLYAATYKWWMPPGYMLALVVPCVVLVPKLILMTPCVDRAVTRIRQGWDRPTGSGTQKKSRKSQQPLML
ncbi:metalloreductase STEAP4-like [Denticeps clupeoides]|uniref:Metalloreductase STEAP4 n=1 Tax=Denticeps clupeoides TaxID=299321 RepID=A0A8C3Z9J8_9TELE|nr:metalloreductase STEAP4-like [Denticeps clupeoides]XP_028825109.1 metalloreductase STEAP4-like [Denticeps clupeoides]XP_028837778.1 metalloreductase STEAP4-like [Denticeps clupeoides]XP_028837779.1 metalloreductase STEAP4-like [Denticeps clupeoides]